MTRKQFQNNLKNSINSNSYNYSENGNLMKKSVSPALYDNPTISNFLNHLSGLVSNLVNNVKRIKRQYIITIDRNDDNID